jgi:MFS family permease
VTIADETAAPRPARAWTAADIAEWKSGWRIVLGAATGMGTGVALYLLVSSIFIEPVTEAFGWTRGDLGLGGMLSFLTGAVALPLIGRALDRFGFRRVALVCTPVLGAIYVAIAVMPSGYWFYLLLMIVGGVFGGGTSAMVYTRPVIASFDRQRGLALGLASAGTSIGAILAAPLLAYMIATYGWRAGFYTLAVLTALIGMPLALVLIGRARESVVRAADDVVHSGAAALARDMPVREAIRDSRFWLLALAIVCVNLPGSGVLGQLAPLVSDTGLGEAQVAAVMSIYAVGLLLGRLLTGFALDRFPAPVVGAAATLVPAIGIALLLWPSPTFALTALAIALIGIQQGSEIDLLGYFISRSFGLKHYGAIYGLIAMAGALATAAALVSFGEVHDATGSYDVALMIGAVLFCLGALAFWAIGWRR